jgi:hypothetical protein
LLGPGVFRGIDDFPQPRDHLVLPTIEIFQSGFFQLLHLAERDFFLHVDLEMLLALFCLGIM